MFQVDAVFSFRGGISPSVEIVHVRFVRGMIC